MEIPKPEVGLILNYSYLWHREAQSGQEEGSKDRPTVIVAVIKGNRVLVVPITHTPPANSEGLEIPAPLKKQLALDHEKAWVITSEFNTFDWPGPDLRPIRGKRINQMIYGKFPPNFMKQIVSDVREKVVRAKSKSVNRD